MAATAMVFRHRASELLRQKIAKHGNKLPLDCGENKSSRTTLCWSVYSLLTADVAARNFEAAMMHARILRHFLQPDDPTIAVTESRLLPAVLYNDVQRSSVSLTRPTFNHERLAADQIQTATMFAKVSASGKYTPQQSSPSLDSSLRSSDLRALFLQIRHLVEIAGMMTANPILATAALIIYVSTWVLICEGKLVNFIISVDKEKIKKTSVLGPESEHQFAAQAALYWLRRISQHEGCGVQLSMTAFNAGPIVLSRLTKYLLGTDSALSSEDSFQDRAKINSNTTYEDGKSTSEPTVRRPSTSSRLKLWISYVAAIAERASPARGNDFQSGFLSKA
jgi:hypothetical protein